MKYRYTITSFWFPFYYDIQQYLDRMGGKGYILCHVDDFGFFIKFYWAEIIN